MHALFNFFVRSVSPAEFTELTKFHLLFSLFFVYIYNFWRFVFYKTQEETKPILSF